MNLIQEISKLFNEILFVDGIYGLSMTYALSLGYRTVYLSSIFVRSAYARARPLIYAIRYRANLWPALISSKSQPMQNSIVEIPTSKLAQPKFIG